MHVLALQYDPHTEQALRLEKKDVFEVGASLAASQRLTHRRVSCSSTIALTWLIAAAGLCVEPLRRSPIASSPTSSRLYSDFAAKPLKRANRSEASATEPAAHDGECSHNAVTGPQGPPPSPPGLGRARHRLLERTSCLGCF
ncbi:unnamed protein product [Cylicocyclus nassatus]|uniref:Uncharacterized protein n=1 Tax=Cylicocyclus nassatus TaxID=53992 RepID=A0AA36LZ84_CYLNA|nr:unnamed protein product [Cylicocyclus nassatus]